VIAGSAFGQTAPVEIFSPILYVDARMPATAELDLPPEHEERAVYVAEGRITIAGEAQAAGRLVVLAAGTAVAVRAEEASRLMILGGAPLDGERHIWWNFVHSDPTRIERAKADWAEGRFPKIPGETEFIPLPKG
jgi:redox-sensitive bicupin YhaK (pirin superfamily)